MQWGTNDSTVPQRKPRECLDTTRNVLADREGQTRGNGSGLLRKRQMMDKGGGMGNGGRAGRIGTKENN
jgi:hypothetical protein